MAKPFRKLGTFGAMNPRRGLWKLKPVGAAAPESPKRWTRAWWRDQVIDWAYRGTTAGDLATVFGPDQPVNWRERLAVFLLKWVL